MKCLCNEFACGTYNSNERDSLITFFEKIICFIPEGSAYPRSLVRWYFSFFYYLLSYHYKFVERNAFEIMNCNRYPRKITKRVSIDLIDSSRFVCIPLCVCSLNATSISFSDYGHNLGEGELYTLGKVLLRPKENETTCCDPLDLRATALDPAPLRRLAFGPMKIKSLNLL